MSIDDLDRRVCVWESTCFIQMMVDGVNGAPTNTYAAVSQLSGLAEVIVDSGRKATSLPSGYNRRRLNALNRTEPNRLGGSAC